MSSGGVAQLVAIGAQDAFLVGNPQVSFFQSMYKHHTNFSQVVDRQVIQGNPTSGGMTTVKFERKGDMIGYVYLVGNNGSNTYATYDWSNVVNYAELYIGGQLIDTQDSKFTEYLAVDLFAQNLSKSALGSFHGGAGTLSYFYPFRFFFCENWQSALPLVGLQYHDVEIRIYWNQPNSDPTYGVIKNWDCYTQYIFLDRRLAIEEEDLSLRVGATCRCRGARRHWDSLGRRHPTLERSRILLLNRRSSRCPRLRVRFENC